MMTGVSDARGVQVTVPAGSYLHGLQEYGVQSVADYVI